jgi:hypothetical protein
VHHRTAIFILTNMATKKQVENFNGIDEATDLIELGQPYTVSFTVQGTGKMLMHCWNISSIAEKAAAKKNSATKKTDNLESYVLRDDQKKIVMPTLNFCAAIREAGKSFSDPTSPRKSMKDRLKAIIIPNEEYGYINGGVTTWDFVDSRRVVIQRAGITRQRPGFYEGWEIEFSIIVLEPEFLPLAKLVEIVDNAGKFQGLGDFRPTFGRFRIKDVHLVE